MKKELILLVLLLLLLNMVFAHGGESESVESKAINGIFETFLSPYIIAAVFIFSIIPFLILKFFKKKISKQHIYFWIIVYLISAITLIIIFDTINMTINSETKGPVHWHADYQIWKCGEKLDIAEPKGLANRVGTRLVHEHNDNRIHVEGIIKDLKSADLHNFFNVINGHLNENSFSVLTNNGVVKARDGELCNGEAGEIQIFLYVVKNADASQRSGFLVEQLKVNGNYILSPYQDVPPGDCIIVEFDKRKEKTDKICETYQVAVEQGKMVIV